MKSETKKEAPAKAKCTQAKKRRSPPAPNGNEGLSSVLQYMAEMQGVCRKDLKNIEATVSKYTSEVMGESAGVGGEDSTMKQDQTEVVVEAREPLGNDEADHHAQLKAAILDNMTDAPVSAKDYIDAIWATLMDSKVCSRDDLIQLEGYQAPRSTAICQQILNVMDQLGLLDKPSKTSVQFSSIAFKLDSKSG